MLVICFLEKIQIINNKNTAWSEFVIIMLWRTKVSMRNKWQNIKGNWFSGNSIFKMDCVRLQSNVVLFLFLWMTKSNDIYLELIIIIIIWFTSYEAVCFDDVYFMVSFLSSLSYLFIKWHNKMTSPDYDDVHSTLFAISHSDPIGLASCWDGTCNHLALSTLNICFVAANLIWRLQQRMCCIKRIKQLLIIWGSDIQRQTKKNSVNCFGKTDLRLFHKNCGLCGLRLNLWAAKGLLMG